MLTLSVNLLHEHVATFLFCHDAAHVQFFLQMLMYMLVLNNILLVLLSWDHVAEGVVFTRPGECKWLPNSRACTRDTVLQLSRDRVNILNILRSRVDVQPQVAPDNSSS